MLACILGVTGLARGSFLYVNQLYLPVFEYQEGVSGAAWVRIVPRMVIGHTGSDDLRVELFSEPYLALDGGGVTEETRAEDLNLIPRSGLSMTAKRVVGEEKSGEQFVQDFVVIDLTKWQDAEVKLLGNEVVFKKEEVLEASLVCLRLMLAGHEALFDGGERKVELEVIGDLLEARKARAIWQKIAALDEKALIKGYARYFKIPSIIQDKEQRPIPTKEPLPKK